MLRCIAQGSRLNTPAVHGDFCCCGAVQPAQLHAAAINKAHSQIICPPDSRLSVRLMPIFCCP